MTPGLAASKEVEDDVQLFIESAIQIFVGSPWPNGYDT